jgi:hypothetical protein
MRDSMREVSQSSSCLIDAFNKRAVGMFENCVACSKPKKGAAIRESRQIPGGGLVTKMKKVVIKAFGDESKLAIVESDLLDPDAGDVQLSVEYTIVCGSDVTLS